MVLIGLLLAALVFLALGLVFASAPWLIASLAASAVAAFVLWRSRGERTAGRSANRPGEAVDDAVADVLSPAAEPPAAPAPPPVSAPPHSPSGDTAPAATPAARALPATSSPAAPAPSAPPAATGVWVVDGRPYYHRASCASVAEASAEEVPFAQAVDDGFTPCAVCRPGRETATEPAPAAGAPLRSAGAGTAPASASAEVWVIDGRPRYHLADCLIIKDQPAEAISRAQAIEDGFMPCSLCEPSAVRSG